MNNFAKKLALALLLSIPAYAQALVTSGQIYLPHAQTGTMANILGWNNQINLFDNDELSFVFKAQTEAGMNFRRDTLAKMFTPNLKSTVVFGPRNAAGTNADVDVFGLNFNLESVSFKSTVTFDPKVTNWSTNFGVFADLGNWVEGLHVRANLPLQYIKNDLNLTESVATASASTFVGDTVINATGTAIVYANAIAALKGDKTVGDVLTVRSYGKVNGEQHSTKVSDITASIGYNFVSSENGHFGLNVGGLFGAGGKTKAEFMFEPVFGNAGRHGIVGGLDGHAVVWSSDEDKQLTAHLNGNVGYIFANTQKRSYDLTASGKWSRYLAVRKITSIGATTESVYGGIDNMINIGTLDAKIGDYITYDASLLLDMQYNNFNINLGYNFGGHSKEKHKEFVTSISGTYIISDMNNGIDVAIGAAGDASTVSGSTFVPISGNVTGVATAVEVVTTNKTTVIADSWLDKDSVLSDSVMAHSIVGALNYTWRDNDWAPCVGLFGKAELSGNNHNTADLFAVGVQGNVSF